MDLYKRVSYAVSRLVTEQYSTSFSMSTRLFDVSIRNDIYAVYGLVRIADEIVDTYRGDDAEMLLNRLENETYEAIRRGYDANPVVHAFAQTAAQFSIDNELIRAFFASMAMDLKPQEYTSDKYELYIYGSAEVVGLMCLKVFCQNNKQQYDELTPGARALGSAYQKINFLRDIAADYKELGRLYFPRISYEEFDESAKNEIIDDIEKDIDKAKKYVGQLPENSRKAVTLSMSYYGELLVRLKQVPASKLKDQRVRINNGHKLALLASVMMGTRKI